MTNMTDAEISRQLALSIGWPNVSIHKLTDSVWVSSKTEGPKTFDYRDPAVIWPIAERFDAFPVFDYGMSKWYSTVPFADIVGTFADTAAKAVALAVIKSKEQK